MLSINDRFCTNERNRVRETHKWEKWIDAGNISPGLISNLTPDFLNKVTLSGRVDDGDRDLFYLYHLSTSKITKMSQLLWTPASLLTPRTLIDANRSVCRRISIDTQTRSLTVGAVECNRLYSFQILLPVLVRQIYENSNWALCRTRKLVAQRVSPLSL